MGNTIPPCTVEEYLFSAGTKYFVLKAALQAVFEQGIEVTDDCSAVEKLGKVVYLVEGDEANLKITTPGDLILAEAILRAREGRL